MIAVCITSYKNEDYLKELLADLDKQTYKDFKTYIVKDVKGCGKAKNQVIQKALKDKPDYIQMIDSDDRIEPTFLEEGVKRLEKGDVDWVICWGNLFGDRQGYIHSRIPTFNDLTRNNNLLHSWAMFKREIFEKHNFNKDLKSGVDWDHWLRVIKDGYKGAVIKKELYRKRFHNKSVTVTKKKPHEQLRQEVLTAAGFKTDRKYRFHLLGLVHLPVSEKYCGCAFTQKIVKLSKMLLSLGHEVYLYGSEGSDAPCTQFIQTHTLDDIRKEWGEGDNRFEIGYNWKKKNFKHDFNKEKTEATKKYYKNCIEEINRHKRDDDFLLLTMGSYQKSIDKGVKLYLTCEPGIGYRGSYSRFRAFESAYLQNFTYGSEHPRKSINGNYYDRVIPNYFDPKNFEFSEKKDDYFLYIGRMIYRKGVWTAIKATASIGAKLKLAGQPGGEFDVNNLPDHCEYIGFVDFEQRKPLMAKARATFVPTIYLEAFAGTHVESMISGTPVITTNFGVFPETFEHGVHGFRCDTLQDFVDAAKKVDELDPKTIKDHGERYLMDNVKLEFQKWFDDLYQLYLSTKDSSVKGWHHLKY
jgi:glycosyltransferase involved in cell wall biosynthesis